MMHSIRLANGEAARWQGYETARLRHLSPWLLVSISCSLFLHQSPSCHHMFKIVFHTKIPKYPGPSLTDRCPIQPRLVMDPLSFTASLITVAGLVAASSKTIYDLRGKLKSVPKDVEELSGQLNNFEHLLKELESQVHDYRNNSSPQDRLPQAWGSSVEQMQRDVQYLQIAVNKVEILLKKKSRSSKVLLLARILFNEKEVEQHKRKIHTHWGTLSGIQAIVCR